MSDYSLIHNPRCSKSRQALALLHAKKIEPEIILYLKDTLNKSELTTIIEKLGIEPRALLRKSEAEFKANNLNDDHFTDEEIIDFMVAYPKLIERPILMTQNKAVIGRPPEAILTLID